MDSDRVRASGKLIDRTRSVGQLSAPRSLELPSPSERPCSDTPISTLCCRRDNRPMEGVGAGFGCISVGLRSTSPISLKPGMIKIQARLADTRPGAEPTGWSGREGWSSFPFLPNAFFLLILQSGLRVCYMEHLGRGCGRVEGRRGGAGSFPYSSGPSDADGFERTLGRIAVRSLSRWIPNPSEALTYR